MWIRLLLLATVFLFGMGFAAPTEGQQLTVSGEPERIHPQLGAYVEEIVPDEEREYVVDISNPTEQDITALLYMAEAIPALGGGKDFTLPDDPDLGAAAWFTTPDRTITLGAGETKRFLMKLRFPAHVQPGQYIAVIGVYDNQSNTTEISEDAQARFVTQIVRKTGLQVVLNYKLEEAKPPQAIPHAITYEKENEKAFLSILLLNEGGSLSKPEMAVKAKRQEVDKPVLELDARFDSIYAGTVAQYRAELSRALPPGAYVAEVSTNVNGHTEQRQLTFEVIADQEPTRWGTASSGEVVQVAEDGSPLPAPWQGLHRIMIYGGLFLLILVVAWRRGRADKRRDKQAN